MSKRDTDTEIWDEDWFLELKGPEMLFWFYVKDRCDHAGFWRPNFKKFERDTGFRINQKSFLENINSDKERIKVLDCGKWFLTGFISFHFNGKLNINNRYHKSVFDRFSKNLPDEKTTTYEFEVNLTSKRPQLEVHKTKVKARGSMRGGNVEEREKIFTFHVNSFVEYSPKMRADFIRYWTEKNPSGKKMRFELQKTWETKKRLVTWEGKSSQKITPEKKQKNEYPENVSIPMLDMD